MCMTMLHMHQSMLLFIHVMLFSHVLYEYNVLCNEIIRILHNEILKILVTWDYKYFKVSSF